MIACPMCGSDQIRADEIYGPDSPRMYATCQVCGEDFDVKVVCGEVKLAPVIYHPGLPCHDADDPCPLCLGDWPATPRRWVGTAGNAPSAGATTSSPWRNRTGCSPARRAGSASNWDTPTTGPPCWKKPTHDEPAR